MNVVSTRPPVFLMIDSDLDNCVHVQRAFVQSAVVSKLVVVHGAAALVNYLTGEGQFANRSAFPLPSVILLALGRETQEAVVCLSWLKATLATRRLPVVILSSVKNEQYMSQFYGLGAAGFIVRPDLFSELLVMINSLDDYWSRCTLPVLSQLTQETELTDVLGETTD